MDGLKLFLVRYEYSRTYYMDKTTAHKDMRLVWAKSEWGAEQAIQKEYEEMCDPYGVNYYVNYVEATEALVSDEA